MLKKAYVEISNICNLNCSFCHGTSRIPKYMTVEEFEKAVSALQGTVEYLYFHLMGEPLLHPKLEELFAIAREKGFKVILTTNGTLLNKRSSVLLSAKNLHKVSISLHCYEANDIGMTAEAYLNSCFEFCAQASKKDVITVMRLWNIGGKDKMNEAILKSMHSYFPNEWKQVYSGYKLADKVFLEWGNKFDWPDINAEFIGEKHSCYGLRDQIGILVDGTVVPCCLDADGMIPLGNIFVSQLEDILSSPRAINLKRSFEERKVCEELCKRCGFATRFVK